MTASTLTPVASLFRDPSRYSDRPVEVAGWLTSARFGKHVGFLVLSDGSSATPLQVVLPDALLQAQSSLRSLGAGCSVRVHGHWVASKGAGQAWELKAESVAHVGAVEDPEHYPIQPKALTDAFLRQVPHLRHRVPRVAAGARLRHLAARAIHDHLDRAGFLWVATPVLTAADAEGAGARFSVHTEGKDAFFGEPAYLTVSGQLAGEALCAALSRVYAFGPTFRAEHSQTPRHLAEFWMVEPEWAFATLDDLIGLAEGLVKEVVRACLTQGAGDLALCAREGGRSLADWQAFADAPFVRMSYSEAVARLERLSGFDVPVRWGMDFQAEHEKALMGEVGGAVAVTDYPTGIKPFYMRRGEDGRTVAAMDVLVPGVGELIGGSVREERADVLDARMEAMGLDLDGYASYRALRRCGSVPHGGFGLGFERLVAFLSGAPSVRDAIAYPRAYGLIAE